MISEEKYKISFHENAFETWSTKCRPFCSGLNTLMIIKVTKEVEGCRLSKGHVFLAFIAWYLLSLLGRQEAISVEKWQEMPIYYHHDDIIEWKHFPRYWPFLRGIHRSPVNSFHKGHWRGALMFSLICAWTNGSANHRNAGDLRCHRTHYDITVMMPLDNSRKWDVNQYGLNHSS